jgi:hypothetical protein
MISEGKGVISLQKKPFKKSTAAVETTKPENNSASVKVSCEIIFKLSRFHLGLFFLNI